MTIRYIDRTTGLDGNSGLSPATAWQTLSKIGSSVFVPGDQLLLKRGEIWREIIQIHQSGTSTNPIIIGAYGTGARPIVDGTVSLTSWTNSATNIYWATLSGAVAANMAWELDEFLEDRKSSLGAVMNAGDWFHDIAAARLYVFKTSTPTTVYASQRQGADIYGVEWVTVTDLHFRRCQEVGIDLSSAPNCTILSTTIDDCSFHCIQYQNGSTGLVDSCELSNPGLRMGDGAGIELINGAAVTIINSHLFTNRTYSIGNIEGIRVEKGGGAASHSTISNNVISDFHYAAICLYNNGGGFISATRNRLFGCGYHGVLLNQYGDAHDVTIAYNLIYRNGPVYPGRGVEIMAGSTNANIFNNVLFENECAIHIEDDCTGCVIQNNIGVGSRSYEFQMEPGAEVGAIVDYNCFYKP